MKRKHTKALLLGLLWLPTIALAQEKCQVLLPAIADEYEGECRRGLAHGQGHALGLDEYEGDFKRGLPHGKGTYTWANGDYYIGKWKKGLRHGSGEMHYHLLEGDSVVEGLWRKGELAENNHYENAYKEEVKRSISRTSARRISDGNKIRFRIVAVHGIWDLYLTNSSGHQRQFTAYTGEIYDLEFPFEGSIKFKTYNKLKTQTYYCELRFTISEPGLWELKLHPN